MDIPVAADLFRLYEIPNVPASGPHDVDKRLAIAWGTLLESLLNSSAASLGFATRASLLADLAHGAGTLATVYADNTPANNGLYVKSNVSGSGTWTRIGDSARGIVRLTVTGGTGNAITASMPETPLVPGDKLYLLTPGANNLAGGVTINGTPVKDFFGNDPAANALITGSQLVLGYSVDHYQLLISSQVDASGILTAALAAESAASGFATAAASSASALGNQVHQYDTRALAIAATIPTGVQAIKVTRRATGRPLSYATYIPGTSAGPEAFQEAGGHWWELDLSGPVVLSSWFDIVADGATDDVTALNVAAAKSAGKTLLIEGLCGLSDRVFLPSNITVMGRNNRLDGFTALGSNAFSRGLLYANNRANVKITGLGFFGNLVEPVAFSTGAINFELDLGAIADMDGLEISRCFFSSFRTTYWVSCVSAAQLGNVQKFTNIKIYLNEVEAAAGCATTFAQSGNNGNFFCNFTANVLFGQDDNRGSIQDVVFALNTAQGFGLSGMLACFTNSRNVAVIGNNTQNMGHDTIPEDRAYTYLFYNSNPAAADPSDITFAGNVGVGNHNNFLYAAGARRFAAIGNTASGTASSSVSPTLPHGFAMAFNGATDITCIGNVLTDNPGGIFYGERHDLAGTNVFADNQIRSATTSAFMNTTGILINPDSAASVGENLTTTVFEGNNITIASASSAAIQINGSFQLGRIRLVENIIKAGVLGIVSNTDLIATEITIRGGSISGTMANAAISIGCGASPLYIEGLLVDFSEVVAGSSGGVLVGGNTAVHINNLTLANKINGGAALSAINTHGTVRNVNAPGIGATTPLAAASSLGLAKPTFSAPVGAMVQNLAPAEAGSGGSKYVVDHWINLSGSTTWQDQRYLTGN